MDVVIYARFSSLKQNETSIEAQLEECYNYCKQNSYIVVGEYIDRAMTAKTDDRPDFQKMIADSNKRLFQGIVVYQLDRFARNKYDSAIYKRQLKKNGVKVYSAKEHISDDASGILIESVLEGMAEYYSAELSQKVTRNMKQNAERGLFNGGYVPLGYKVVSVDFGTYTKKKLEVDPETAPIVKEIFEMRANDINVMDIVKYLNNKGYKTIQGKPFKKTSLQKILSNKRYIGINKYKDMEFKNTIPALIEEELFERVQRVIEKYKHAPGIAKADEEYILTTKLFCGHCKHKMVGICGTSKTGTVYKYYRCNGTVKDKCERKNIPKYLIEELVVKECKKILTTDNIETIAKIIYEICQKENSQSYLLKALNKKIKDLGKNIENLIIALENGENVDLISNRITEKRKELDITKKQYETESNKLINLTERQIKVFLKQLKDGNIDDIKYRKMLVNLFVNKIYVYDDELTIIFNIGKTPLTVNKALLKDVETNLKKSVSSYLDNLGSPN